MCHHFWFLSIRVQVGMFPGFQNESERSFCGFLTCIRSFSRHLLIYCNREESLGGGGGYQNKMSLIFFLVFSFIQFLIPALLYSKTLSLKANDLRTNMLKF